MPDAFERSAHQLSRPGELPDGADVPVLDAEAVNALAGRFDLTRRRVQVQALGVGIVPAAYLKNIPAYGFSGQIRLLESRAALVGLGGLGGGVLDCLLRLGMGRVRVADGDRFEETNLNRQLLCTRETLGQGKAKASRARAASVNPACELDVWQAFLDEDCFDHFLADTSVVLDALGGFAGRIELARAASRSGVPLVTGAINGQTGLVSVAAPGGTSPFELMRRQGSEGERIGSLAPPAMAVGAVMANQAASLVADGSASLAGKMLVMDLAQGCFDTVTF